MKRMALIAVVASLCTSVTARSAYGELLDFTSEAMMGVQSAEQLLLQAVIPWNPILNAKGTVITSGTDTDSSGYDKYICNNYLCVYDSSPLNAKSGLLQYRVWSGRRARLWHFHAIDVRPRTFQPDRGRPLLLSVCWATPGVGGSRLRADCPSTGCLEACCG